ncbi:MAG: tRNA (N(6)-L-threonylcarbamoyladenosine(37)-C(2))-methylthiotransferase [Candidatus Freyarchaeota archaeon]|nr:tRNA (N(6)-L-threonylcarbamoyladenosine(37)-C(2))-methylthiotransferase [Candidatus Jordarchaeia archaeon]
MAAVSVIVHGCSMSQAEAEMIMGLLREAGFSLVSPEQAEITIILTCGVKGHAEHACLKAGSELAKKGKKVIMAGCLPAICPEKVEATGCAAMVDPNAISGIVDVVKRVEAGERKTRFLSERKNVHLGLPRVRLRPVINIVPISEGCRGACSYCCVRIARGELYSYPPERILEEVAMGLREGCKEVWLTSQDSGAYNHDGVRLPQLLRRIVELEGDFMVRVGMMNPNHAAEILDELVEVYENPKVYKFIHLPVQSGNNEILKAMNRQYTCETFLEIVDELRSNYPSLTLSTDVIAGFPGESDEQFYDTVSLLKEVEPDIVNVSMFTPRPHTLAARMPNKIPGWEIKRRSRILSQVSNELSLKRNMKWVGWKGDVIITEKARKGGVVARNYAYKHIIIRESVELGERIRVKLEEARIGYLFGSICV